MECGKGAFAHPRLLENLEPIAFAKCSVHDLTGQVESGITGQNRRSSVFIGG
jgi:hypothetical protein